MRKMNACCMKSKKRKYKNSFHVIKLDKATNFDSCIKPQNDSLIMEAATNIRV